MSIYPALIEQPQTFARMLDGVDQLADLLAMTLGPGRGVILSQRGAGKPELLVDSGVIARRVVELPGRAENVGAMLLRNLAWTMHEDYGDGAATAAILARAMLGEARRAMAAGVNAMLLRRGIERGVEAACDALTAAACPIIGGESRLLCSLATTVTGQAELGAILGELFDVLGADGAFIVEEYAVPSLDREYLDGGRWTARPGARALMPPGKAALTLDHPLVLVSLDAPATAEDVLAVMSLAASHPDKRPLLLVTGKPGDPALHALTLNHTRGLLTTASAVVTSLGNTLEEDLADIALLCGATVMSRAAGRPLSAIRPEFFGTVRRASLSYEHLTLIGGAGDAGRTRAEAAALRGRAAKLNRNEPGWERLRLRAARLTGGVGVLKVGAHTKTEREALKGTAEKAARALSGALECGVLPGGGVAYLDAVPALDAAREACADDEARAGVNLVAAALSAPFTQIVRNHGVVHPPLALAEARARGRGWGFDAATGDYALMLDAGIVDALNVTRGALRAAASTAIMALTTDVVVLSAGKRQRPSLKP